MPTPTMPGRARLAACADDRLEHELLDPLHAVGGDAHLQEAHVLRARALGHALDVEAVPVRDELPVDDRQPVAGVGPGVLARDRVDGVRAQRMLDRRALGARLERLRRSAPDGAGSARPRGRCRRRCPCPGRRGSSRSSAIETFLWIMSRHAPPRDRGLLVTGRRERVAQVLRNVLQRPDVEVRGRILDGAVEVGVDGGRHALAFPAAARPARRPKTQHSRSELPIMRLRPCVPPAISPQAYTPSSVVSRVLVDHEAAVLVVQHRVGHDRLAQRVDAGAAVAAEHVRQRDLGVRLGDPGRVEPDRGAAVLRLDALALRHLVEDRLRDRVARAERVGELLAVRVQQHRAVGAGRLGDRVALHRRRPGAAVRVVLERVEVARLGADLERDPGHLAGRVRVVGGELAALASPPRSSGRRPRARPRRPRSPPSRRPSSRRSRASLWPVGSSARERVVGELGAAARLERLAQRLGDRVPGPVADLEQPLARRAAAAGQPVAAVLARELDAELLEPVDRVRRLGRQHLDEPRVGGVVRRAHHVLGVDLRRVVLAEGSLDAALRLRRVARLDRALRRQADARAGPLGRDRRRQPGRAGADHEHVEEVGRRHDHAILPNTWHYDCLCICFFAGPARLTSFREVLR